MDIETRLTRLERSARRWRAACVLLVVVGVVRWHLGATTQPVVPDVIRAHRVEVVNPHGETVCKMDWNINGGTMMVIGTAQGSNAVAQLFIEPDSHDDNGRLQSGAVSVSDVMGSHVATMGVDGSGGYYEAKDKIGQGTLRVGKQRGLRAGLKLSITQDGTSNIFPSN